MKPNYSKLTISLVLAFGLVEDGESLCIIINKQEARQATKKAIFELTLRDDVHEIDIDRRTIVRRWHERYWNRDRRE